MADAAKSTVKKDDIYDLGVPMLKGSTSEYVGPEDALGEGPKRGDYRDRIGPSNYHPHQVEFVDGKPVMVSQRPRAEDIGEAPGKGGVTTADDK